MLLRLPQRMQDAMARPARILFLCRYNRQRSATAERIFCKDPALDVRSAGTSPEARVQVNRRMLDWAEVVFIMDEEQRRDLTAAFPDHPALASLVCLDISDSYLFLDPRLVQMLQDRTREHLEKARKDVGSRQ